MKPIFNYRVSKIKHCIPYIHFGITLFLPVSGNGQNMKSNKTLCSFRFSKEHITKLKRIAKLRKTSMTEVLEAAIVSIPLVNKKKVATRPSQ